MQFTIIGLGGIGSSLADFVSRYISYLNTDEHIITLIDGDSYALDNAQRQVFDELGEKAEITARRLTERFTNQGHENLCFEAISEYVTPENAEFYIEENSIVLLAVDNHKTRKVVSDHCVELKNITLISGGNDLEDGNIQVFIKRENIEITPPITFMHPEIENPEDKLPTEMNCEELAVSEPQIYFANLEAAIGMCSALRQVLTIEEIKAFPYNEVYFDLNSNSKRAVMRW